MAYDPKDPADKKIVADLIKAAVDAREVELGDEHEDNVKGLKAKNTELLGKIANLRKEKGGEDTAADLERAEAELTQVKKDLKAATKSVTSLTAERDEAKTGLESERASATKLLVDQGLTETLTANNVAAQFLPAAKALLGSQVTIKADGEKRVAMVGDKPLSEFVKTWAQSADGKHMVKAPANGGGGSHGGEANGNKGNGITIPYAEYEANPSAYAKQFAEGATLGPKEVAAS